MPAKDPMTAGRDFGNPTLAAPSALVPNSTWMMTLRQVVAELPDWGIAQNPLLPGQLE